MLFNFLQYAPRDRRFTIRVGSILEAYRQQMLNYQQEELEKGGAIYCAGEKIFVENKEGNVLMLW